MNLIPNLVNTVQGYATHEKETLEEVTRLRKLCLADEGSPQHQAASENKLIGMLNKLLVQVENYPDLKANKNFLDLQEELSNTEDRIQTSRRFYNGNVRENNNANDSFPTVLIARGFGFSTRDFFQIDDAKVRVAPSVKI